MFRSAIKVAGAAAAITLAVGACGSVRMGAAAIVGGQRISSATLAAQVSNLNSAYQADRSRTTISYSQAKEPQLVLTWLLRFRVRDEMARRAGLHVTAEDGQAALAALAAQVKQESPSATLSLLAVASGIPPDQMSELGRYLAVQTKLIGRYAGGQTTSSAQQQAEVQLEHAQCLASKDLAIAVNPQYGQLSYAQLVVAAAPSGLSGTPGPSPSPAAAAQASC